MQQELLLKEKKDDLIELLDKQQVNSSSANPLNHKANDEKVTVR